MPAFLQALPVLYYPDLKSGPTGRPTDSSKCIIDNDFNTPVGWRSDRVPQTATAQRKRTHPNRLKHLPARLVDCQPYDLNPPHAAHQNNSRLIIRTAVAHPNWLCSMPEMYKEALPTIAMIGPSSFFPIHKLPSAAFPYPEAIR